MKLQWGSASHVGMMRQQNEDAFIAEEGIFAVADGMGGHNAGEVASALAISGILEASRAGFSTAAALAEAVNQANQSIHRASGGASDQRGMGTTLTALAPLRDGATEPDRVIVANVGDSRVYLYRSGELKQISVDHSYVQELLSEGLISPSEARDHPRRNIVTRALGIDGEVHADTWVVPMVVGDRYVLCSDGLVDEVDDEQIAEILGSGVKAQVAAEQLVNAANEHGGRDNITVVVVDIVADDATVEMSDAPESPTPRRRLRAALVGMAVVLIIGVGATSLAGWYARQGYFVGFDGSTDEARLVVYKGRPTSILWYRPTVHFDSGVVRSEVFAALADDIDARPTYDSLTPAREYVLAIRDLVQSLDAVGDGS